MNRGLMLPEDLVVLSDLDGTLVDSSASVLAGFRWWADLRGLPGDVVDRIPLGRTSTDAAKELAPHLDSVHEGRLLDQHQAEDTAGVVALPGAAALLCGHARVAIVTSCPRMLADARLSAACLPTPGVLLTPELWTKGKPDPEPFLIGAERMRARPSDCVVLEDAPAGVQAGAAAGMTVIAVLTTHARQDLPQASAWIASLLDLPSALGELGLA